MNTHDTYEKTKNRLRGMHPFLSLEDVEDAYHNALLYMIENPPPADVKWLTAVIKTFKQLRFNEYRKNFIDWNGRREPVWAVSVDFSDLEGDTIGSVELEVLQLLSEAPSDDNVVDYDLNQYKTLTFQEREALSLLLSGYSQKETAYICGVSPQAITSRLHHIKRKLTQ